LFVLSLALKVLSGPNTHEAEMNFLLEALIMRSALTFETSTQLAQTQGATNPETVDPLSDRVKVRIGVRVTVRHRGSSIYPCRILLLIAHAHAACFSQI